MKTSMNSKVGTAAKLLKKGDLTSISKKVLKNLTGRDFFPKADFEYLVDATEYKPKLKKAVEFLRDEIGEANLGVYLEFGVSHGSSMIYMHQTLEELGIKNLKLYGFDSFKGLPPVAAQDDLGTWGPGSFRAKLKNVKKHLTKNGINWDNVKLEKGWFKDTLTERFKRKNKIEKASIIMIDCDIYTATKEALEFCKSLIKDKTIIIFDDWHSADLADQGLGEKKAFDEFLIENPQFKAEKFDSYSYFGSPNGEIYLVTP